MSEPGESRATVPPRLSVVTLGARDLPTLRRFYRDLGWAEVPGSDDTWCAFRLGGVVLALFPEADLAAEASTTAERGGFTLALNVDGRHDVDAGCDAMVAAGAMVVAAAQDRSWGGRSAYVADPEGNRWEIAWNPGVVFGPSGEVRSFGG